MVMGRETYSSPGPFVFSAYAVTPNAGNMDTTMTAIKSAAKILFFIVYFPPLWQDIDERPALKESL